MIQFPKLLNFRSSQGLSGSPHSLHRNAPNLVSPLSQSSIDGLPLLHQRASSPISNMSSSSPSSSSPPQSKKRTAKAGGLDTPEVWMPKIRIINFDPSRNPADKPVKSPTTTTESDSKVDPDAIAQNLTSQSSRQEYPFIAPKPTSSDRQPISPVTEVSVASLTPQVIYFYGEPIHPSDPLYPLLTCAKFCENCNTSETSYWRTDDTGKDHCNPCGLHWTKHHTPRPIDPNHEPTPGKLANFACQICPTRKHARRREEYRGIILCNACTDYWKRNNAVRPLIAFAKRPKGDRTREPGMVRQTKKCVNCGTGRSSRWMLGPDGEDNCSECGLFWMYHKKNRPLGVGVGVDVIGPKREPRGPKIMDSRKRRLGSVHTGSGSDSENEGSQCGEENFNRDLRYGTTTARENDGRSQGDTMDVDTTEPPDDSPVSLVKFAVLIRKLQLHFQELSLLNSPLMHRPAISSLGSVIEPLISELSPLTATDLSAFTRSTLSKSVLQNLLAHVTAAEGEATTSEDERLDVVEDDWNFGPDRVGENYYVGESIGEEAIVAAKGLVDLCPKYNPLLPLTADDTDASSLDYGDTESPDIANTDPVKVEDELL